MRKKPSLKSSAKQRRMNVIERLNAQLSCGFKSNHNKQTPLSESDRARIEKELSILKTRI